MTKTSKWQQVRHSPRTFITLPPLTKLLGREQAKQKGTSLSKHIRDLIEAYHPENEKEHRK